MSDLERYSIRLKDLKEGRHEFRFELDDDFFEKTENNLFCKGDITCHLTMDKHNSIIAMHFDLSGHIQVACDRCVASIDLPLSGDYRLILKYREDASPEEMAAMENEGIVLVAAEDNTFDLRPYLRDFSLLMVPAKLVYACREKAPYPCDEEVLNKIGFFVDDLEGKQTKNNSVWNALKDIRWEWEYIINCIKIMCYGTSKVKGIQAT